VAVPEGHYAQENMKLTVVPNRNMLMLAAATAWAISSQYDAVAYACHAGDHIIYPDCRPAFTDAMAQVMSVCDFRPVLLSRPFLHKSKGEIAVLGHQLGVPFRDTWTCYKGEAKPCGVCGACVERAEAFAFAGKHDPLER
jgi:7-cyano-7-deazaguanine synthase